MNAPVATGNRTLSLVEVPPRQAPSGGFASGLLDLYGEAMDKALGVERTSISAMAELNSCAVDTCERLTGDFMETIGGWFAACMQAQLNWFNLVSEGSKALMAVAVPVGVLAYAGNGSAQASAGVLDHGGMDIVLGEDSGARLAGMARGIVEDAGPGGQAEPADSPERGMDVVIGETAA